MTDFKGFNDWIEIFRGGKQMDSNGREHNGDALIQNAVDTFDPAKHEPPVVVGHPKDNAPAFGWVQGLRTSVKNGATILEAKFKDIVPEFEAIVKQGLFKKRSASFYPDGRLRHVGFLGAAPPAVKGLADLKFDDADNAISFEDINNQTGGKSMDFKEFIEGMKWWKKEVEDAARQPGASPNPAPPPPAAGDVKTFTEADIEAAKKEAEAAARKKAEVDFAEQTRKVRQEAAQKEISVWCDQLVKSGKIAPAWIDMGLKEFCQGLPVETEVSFTEKVKATPSAWFRQFIETLPKLVNFDEIAKRDGAATGSAAEKMEALIRAKMEKKPDLGYVAAFNEVQTENRDLALEYANELTQ